VRLSLSSQSIPRDAPPRRGYTLARSAMVSATMPEGRRNDGYDGTSGCRNDSNAHVERELREWAAEGAQV
jgi:hypothetical protein